MDFGSLMSFILGLMSTSSQQNVKEFQQTGPSEMISKPAFCNNLDCPPFKTTVLREKTGGLAKIEMREYQTTHWVSDMRKIADLKNVDEDTRGMFMKLFNYIEGANMGKTKIPMTCPVVMGIHPGQGPACSSNITMSFYLTTATSPAPTDSAVYLDTVEPQQYYVISYGGRPDFKEKQKMVEELGSFLTKKGISDFVQAPWFTAGYNSPFTLFNRHNEIWFKKESKQSAGDKQIIADNKQITGNQQNSGSRMIKITKN